MAYRSEKQSRRVGPRMKSRVSWFLDARRTDFIQRSYRNVDRDQPTEKKLLPHEQKDFSPNSLALPVAPREGLC